MDMKGREIMDYKVLYRKYRPTCFSNIVGQDSTITMLKNAIVNDKISHAYLFTGPRGTGKTSTAKVFAKTINCENRINGEACGKCNSCLNFSQSSDIIEIDAASNNGVDDIRELINNVKIAPTMSKYKIYIIDEVHMMSQSAFNALLLTLEEPPSHAIFIMATTNVESVPITILSRCQRFNFKKIELETIKNQLSKICQDENIKITPEALEEISYLSEGGLRDALSLLDQLSSENEEITLDKILINYGSISSLFIKNLISTLENNDVDGINKAMLELENSSSDYKVFIKKLVKELISKAILIKQNNLSSNLKYEDIKNLIIELNDCFNKISINLNPYLLIKIILLNYVKPESKPIKEVEKNVSSIVSETQKVDKKIINEEKDSQEKDIVEDVLPTFNEELNEYLEELKNIRVNNCFALAEKSILNTYQQKFKEINLKDFAEFESLLIDVKVMAAGKQIAILSAPLSSTADLLNHHLEQIESKLSTLLDKNIKIIVIGEDEWNNYRQEYVQNLKNGVKYEVIDESGLQELKPSKTDSQLKQFAEQIFEDKKIEII